MLKPAICHSLQPIHSTSYYQIITIALPFSSPYLTDFMELNPSLEVASHAATQELEPEGSQPCSQERSTGPYPEPD
jgi:hypothetical protein